MGAAEMRWRGAVTGQAKSKRLACCGGCRCRGGSGWGGWRGGEMGDDGVRVAALEGGRQALEAVVVHGSLFGKGGKGICEGL